VRVIDPVNGSDIGFGQGIQEKMTLPEITVFSSSSSDRMPGRLGFLKAHQQRRIRRYFTLGGQSWEETAFEVVGAEFLGQTLLVWGGFPDRNGIDIHVAGDVRQKLAAMAAQNVDDSGGQIGSMQGFGERNRG
jgi:hypothetical protein